MKGVQARHGQTLCIVNVVRGERDKSLEISREDKNLEQNLDKHKVDTLQSVEARHACDICIVLFMHGERDQTY